MKLLVTVLLAFVVFSVFGQNIITLKSGEQIKGKVLSYQDSVLTVDFRGSKMTFKLNELATVQFGDGAKSSTSDEGLLKGVITYYFNKTQGDKSDVGAQVYLLLSSELKANFSSGKEMKIDTAILKAFDWVKTCRPLANHYGIDAKEVGNTCKDYINRYNALSKEGWQDFDLKVMESAFTLSNMHPKIIKITADGSGNYSKKLASGKYLVLIKSRGRTSLNVTESEGNITYREIEIKNGQEFVLDFNFEL